MKLRTARLCLDCDEVHDAADAEVFRKLVVDGDEEAAPGVGRRVLKHGVIGLAALGLAGWFWRGRDSEAAARTAKPSETKADIDDAP